MADPAAPPLASGRHFELLSRQRQKAQRRLFRERSRNARLAVVGVASLAVLLGLGLHSGWMLTSSPAPAPLDARSREFAATHVGHIQLSAGEGVTCRVLDFHNDSGAITEGRRVLCVEAPDTPVDPLASDANGRASSIRGFFSRR